MKMKLTDQHEISWTKIEPLPDPKHGKPCARSSHGVSMVQNGTRLIVMGGEHVARTPIEGNQTYWACDKKKKKDGEEEEEQWQWRCLEFDSHRPPDRIAHAQAVVPEDNNCVYMFGGRAGITMEEKAMNDLWKLDCSGAPGSETWSPVHQAAEGNPPPPEARSFHKMIGLSKNLYMFGGCTAGHGRSKDLFQFDVTNQTWKDLGPSPLLRGRGGPNLLSFDSGKKLGAVAGFAGEETADGHIFDLMDSNNKWNDNLLEKELDGMRPRSVCVSGSFPSLGISIIFGGEVDPSDRGHEGAGGFENDIVVLDESTGKFLSCIKKPQDSDSNWPRTRGWSDSATGVVDEDGSGKLYIFGGLSGDDKNPERLDDLWVLNIQKAA